MVLISVAWIAAHHSGVVLPISLKALLPGMAVFAAAFILSWGAELAMLDIPGALAFAFLAVIAVLPEYAVDIYFAWTAAKNPEYVAYATANMTGANRLLIGFGWPVILFAYWLKRKKNEIILEKNHGLSLSVLFCATVYSFLIPIKGSLSMFDALVLITIFVVYIYKVSRTHLVEPELEGITEIIGSWSLIPRRTATILFFVLAGYTIYVAAEPFAEGLLEVGRHFEIEEFILVQWLAPLASESPEFIIAILFALKVNPQGSFTTLISSKINQWTLLVGMLPLAYILSLGDIGVMHLDFRQREEIFLTSAQSLFAIVLLADFKFTIREAMVLFLLFATQLYFVSSTSRLIYAIFYILLSILIFAFLAKKRAGMFSLFGKERKF